MPRTTPDRRGRIAAIVVSAAMHLAVGGAMLLARDDVLVSNPLPPVLVTMVELQPPPPAAMDPAPQNPASQDPGSVQATAPVATPRPEPAPPRPRIERPSQVLPPDVETIPTTVTATVAPMATSTVSEARLVGALRAGSVMGSDGAGQAGPGPGAGGGGTGGGGPQCDMLKRVQTALRDDPEVRAAIAEANRAPDVGGRAMLMWDGDWVQTPGQTGKGLAGVRQAIALEVAFAPAACRTQPMSGLVLVSMADTPGAARLAWGMDRWRWSDLLR